VAAVIQMHCVDGAVRGNGEADESPALTGGCYAGVLSKKLVPCFGFELQDLPDVGAEIYTARVGQDFNSLGAAAACDA